MELVEFLLARVAEDEAVARAATVGPWSIDEHTDQTEPHWAIEGPTPEGERWPLDVVEVSSDRDYYNPEGGCLRLENAVHIARHNPARVLAECKAKRRIIERADNWDGEGWWPQDVLHYLAAVYADHPDYREAWRPC